MGLEAELCKIKEWTGDGREARKGIGGVEGRRGYANKGTGLRDGGGAMQMKDGRTKQRVEP